MKNQIKDCGFVDYLIDFTLRAADNDGKNSYDERVGALFLMTEIWLNYTEIIDRKEDIMQQMIEVLKKGIRDTYKNLRINALAFSFRLLD